MKDSEEYRNVRVLIGQAIIPPMSKEVDRVKTRALDFAHYTSAETAFLIIKTQSIILRNALLMNDTSELTLGLNAIYNGFDGTDTASGTFWHKAKSIHPEIEDKFYTSFKTAAQRLIQETYITCLSEFCPKDGLGKLSMWRAYGFPNGVALIMDREKILSNTTTVDITTYPVFYTERGTGFCKIIPEIINGIVDVTDKFKEFNIDVVVAALIDLCFHLAICIKDSNFVEEDEWRAVYRPDVYSFETTKYETMIIGGTPQLVRKLELGDNSNIRLKDIIKKVIIGPTEHPEISRDAFVHLLREEGFEHPELKVEIARIPFRG